MLSAFPFTAGLQVPTGLETVLASMPIDFSDLESKEIQDRNVRSAAETARISSFSSRICVFGRLGLESTGMMEDAGEQSAWNL